MKLIKVGRKKVQGLNIIKKLFAVLTVLYAFAPVICEATNEIHVPEDYKTIQGAIDNAKIGDTILVSPGRYVENLYLPKKDITIRSVKGPKRTVISGGGKGSVITYNSGATSGSIIDGFTITEGNAEAGGGIYMEYSSPTILNSIIIGNNARDGGGIFCFDSSSPLIKNCVIADNTAKKGAGIFCLYSSAPEIIDSRIDNNYASVGGGLFSAGYSSPLITNCSVNDNNAGWFGNWIFYFNSSPMISDCTINGEDTDYGDGIYCYFLHFIDIMKSDKSTITAFNVFSWYMLAFELLIMKVCFFVSLKDSRFDKWLDTVEERYVYKEYTTSVHEYLKNHV